MEDVKFHQCVRLDDFVADRTISFIPPDGSFEVMTYRLPSASGTFSVEGSATSPLLLFIPDVTVNVYSGTRVEIFFKLKSNNSPSNPHYKKRSNNASTVICNEICIEIPIEEDAMNMRLKNPKKLGKIQYRPEKNAIVWRIKRIPLFFTRDVPMKVEYNLPSIRSSSLLGSSRPAAAVLSPLTHSQGMAAAGMGGALGVGVASPVGHGVSPSTPTAALNVPSTLGVVKIYFEIPYFSVSGLQVKYLKIIEKSGYQALPWVRYITQNGQYQMRLPPANIY